MPEIDIRAGQQQAAAKRVGPEELAKTEYRLQQFFQKQAQDVYVQMGRNERIRQQKIKEVNDQEVAARRRMVNDAYRENQDFNARERRTRREQQDQEKREYNEAHKMNRQMDADKRRTDRGAASDTARKAREDEAQKRREFLRLHADATRDDRERERLKNRDARDTYSSAVAENRAIDAEKKRVERERLTAGRLATREAAREADREAEYRRAHSFTRGAAIGGGAAGILGAITGGSPPSRIVGAGLGALAGGMSNMAFGGGAGIAAMIAEAVAQVVMNPAAIANAITKPWQDYRVQAFEVARSSFQPGESLYNQFFPRGGVGGAPDWMQRLGIGPMDALRSLSTLGVAPSGDAGDMQRMVMNMRGFALSPAFAGMQPGTVEAITGQGMAQGNVSQAGFGMNTYLTNFSRILEEATHRGMDRSSVLNNMMGSLDSMSKGGALGTNVEGMSDLFYRFMNSGFLGGRTGEMAASAAAGSQQVMENLGQNKPALFGILSQAGKWDHFRSVAGIQKYIGAENWQKYGQNPDQARMRDRLVQQAMAAARDGNQAEAVHILSSLITPPRLAELQQPVALAMAGGRDYAAAEYLPSLAGMTYAQSQAYLNTPGGPAPLGRAPGFNAGLGLSANVGRAPGGAMAAGGALGQTALGFDNAIGEQGYMSMLTAGGIPEATAKSIVQAGRLQGVSPLVLASIGQVESQNNPNQGWNKSHQGFGPMQISPENVAAFPEAALVGGPGNYVAGARVLKEQLAGHGGALSGALTGYSGNKPGTAGNAEYQRQYNEAYRHFAGGGSEGMVPTEIFASQANEQYQSIQSASLFQGAVVAANRFSDALSGATNALVAFTSSVNAANPGRNLRRPVPFAPHVP